nr:translationally-controlled tumor protein homolog isoform X2 [Oncorhynchus nerka]
MVSRTENIDDCLLGANASAEVQDDGCESSTVSGVDIVLNHKLQETSFTKDSYKGYIKDYMKAIKAKLEENNPDRVKPFMAGAQEEIKKIMGNMKNYQVTTSYSYTSTTAYSKFSYTYIPHITTICAQSSCDDTFGGMEFQAYEIQQL